MGQYADILALATETARKAGDFVRDARREGLVIDAKSRVDFVSDKDKMSEEIIRNAIREKYPSHLFFGEESTYGESPEEEQARIESFTDEDYVWVVDPIDGTVNYIRNFPQYAISIAVLHRRQLVVGVIYDPLHKDMYYAEKGCGAFVNGNPIRVSEAASAADAIVNTSMPMSSMDLRRKMVAKLPAVSERFQSMRIWNCAALSLASVAAGHSDADYETGIHLWDMGAGIVIVREAGGEITQIDGSPFTLTATGLLASNGKVHAETLEVLNGVSHGKR